MSDIRRLTLLGVVFLVVLRLGIGWHLFDQGLRKKESMGTSAEWTAEGYLKNSRGPLREHFRSYVDDPDGLNWLDYDWVDRRWSNWEERFKQNYELEGRDVQRFDELMNGPGEIVSGERMTEPPPDIVIGGSLAREKIIEMRKDSKGKWFLAVNGRKHLLPAERDALLREAKGVERKYQAAAERAAADGNEQAEQEARKNVALVQQFAATVQDVYARNARLGYREQLKAMLVGDSERVGRINDELNGTVDAKIPGKAMEYKDRLKKRDEMLAGARTDFQHEHLEQEEARIRELYVELVAPIKAMEEEMQSRARSRLSAEQLEQGFVPVENPDQLEGFALLTAAGSWMFLGGDRPDGVIRVVDAFTMWALLVLGMLLIVGLFSRTAAFLGAALVFSFYLAMPPFPGVPQTPGPDVGLIVNKNLIEVLALLALAAIPTGKLFGIDSMFIGLCCGRGPRGAKSAAKSKSKSTKKQQQKTESKPAEPASVKKESQPAAPSQPATAKPATAATSPTGDTYSIRPDQKK